MTTQNEGDLKLLQASYRGLRDEASVAFVDEAYRLHSECRSNEQPFYALAAVVLTVSIHDVARTDLRNIVEGDWWHTVEAQQSLQGRRRIQAMTEYLAAYKDPCVLSVQHTPQTHESPKEMRAASLSALLAAVGGNMQPPAGITLPETDMIVFEKQQHRADTQRDLHTLKGARAAGHIDRHYRAHHVSPAIEPLLWLPDLVSHTYRRYITHGEQLVTLLSEQTITVDATQKKSDPLEAAAYIQGVSRLSLTP